MKKLLVAAAALAAGVASASIVSSSIVGYNTVTIDKQYAILAVNFGSVSGGAMNIQDAIPYAAGMTQGASSATADNVQIMQSDGTYKTYYMSNGKVGKTTYDTVGKWVDMDDKTVAASVTIPSGTAFWYASQNYATPYVITVAGEVLATTSDTKDIAQTYMLVASPYPVALPLNDCVVVEEGGITGASSATADNLQIMQDDGTYKTYYLSNGKVGKTTYDTVGKWVDMDDKTVATTATFPIGKGAWFVSQNASAKLKFINPMGTPAE